jgi:hypothetical protein
VLGDATCHRRDLSPGAGFEGGKPLGLERKV